MFIGARDNGGASSDNLSSSTVGLSSMTKSLPGWLLDSLTFPLLSSEELRASFTELEALMVECSLSVGVQPLSTGPGLCAAVREGGLELANGRVHRDTGVPRSQAVGDGCGAATLDLLSERLAVGDLVSL